MKAIYSRPSFRRSPRSGRRNFAGRLAAGSNRSRRLHHCGQGAPNRSFLSSVRAMSSSLNCRGSVLIRSCHRSVRSPNSPSLHSNSLLQPAVNHRTRYRKIRQDPMSRSRQNFRHSRRCHSQNAHRHHRCRLLSDRQRIHRRNRHRTVRRSRRHMRQMNNRLTCAKDRRRHLHRTRHLRSFALRPAAPSTRRPAIGRRRVRYHLWRPRKNAPRRSNARS
jgi:hypothetical protein